MTCEFEGCELPATCTVRTVTGPKRLCDEHGWIVREIEAEWDRAEAESSLHREAVRRAQPRRRRPRQRRSLPAGC